jgi:4-amino-4-deoxy-L-arabinose transferase-like glycosyltransferase
VDRRRARLGAALLALLTGVVVWWLAVDLFPHHSVNDDEGVYLTQAAMLLEGHLFLYPGALSDLVRPWFFVVTERAGETAMYSKYSPVVAALFAPGVAAGAPRVVLGLVAAGNAALVYALAAAAFDRRTGLVAVGLLAASPLFLFTSAVFLPYAPTTLFCLAFALAYVRAARRDDRRYALAAGAAIGVAFFARPYTAVLFAAPFIGHTLLVLHRARVRGRAPFRRAVARSLAVAGPGLVFVGMTLGYNAVVTGDPLRFPYHAFAPRDGPGFGHRAILGYDVRYTPALAAETTARLLSRLPAWTGGGAVGAALALLGAGRYLRDVDRPLRPATGDLPDRTVAGLVLLVAPTVILGQAYFWGTLNGLRNSLIELLGPYYHFPLLLPFAAFGAHGAVWIGERASRAFRRAGTAEDDAEPATGVRLAVAALVLIAVAGTAVVGYGVAADPYAENRERTADLAAAYEPFDRTTFEHAVVFHPTPYGDWIAHPFQRLRNGPGFDGPAVYVFDEGPAADVRALDATGDRRPYRYTYQGTWNPGFGDSVDPALVPLSVREGDRLAATTTVGVPLGAVRGWVRVETTEGYARYPITLANETIRIRWTATPDRAAVVGRNATGGAPPVLPEGPSEVDLVVTFATRSGATVSYRQETTVDVAGDTFRVVWPPETRICTLATECGHEGTWVGPDGDYPTGTSVQINGTVR